jgi:hypothetical protein
VPDYVAEGSGRLSVPDYVAEGSRRRRRYPNTP